MAKAAPHTSRNPLLVGNVNQFSRSQSNSRAGVWAKKSRKVAKKAVAAKPTIAKTTKSRFYATEDKTRPMPSRKSATVAPVKLRGSITPGTVLILLAGRYKGSRVVFLKQLDSGLLLVTGTCEASVGSVRGWEREDGCGERDQRAAAAAADRSSSSSGNHDSEQQRRVVVESWGEGGRNYAIGGTVQLPDWWGEGEVLV